MAVAFGAANCPCGPYRLTQKMSKRKGKPDGDESAGARGVGAFANATPAWGKRRASLTGERSYRPSQHTREIGKVSEQGAVIESRWGPAYLDEVAQDLANLSRIRDDSDELHL